MFKKILDLNKKIEQIIEKCTELTFVGNPVLRGKATEVTFEESLEIGNRLQETLKKIRELAGYGRGLAAPQIGENKSVFVTFVNDVFTTYCNPKIINKSEAKNLYRENCLSCGPLWGDVVRSQSIVMEYQDIEGNTQTVEADSFLARLLQHEYDHLEGIVNLDIAEKGTIEFMLSDPLKEELRNI